MSVVATEIRQSVNFREVEGEDNVEKTETEDDGKTESL